MGKKPKKLDYSRATEFIKREKIWDGPETFSAGWTKSGTLKVPASFKLTAPLRLDGDTVEGCFVVALYKRSQSGLSPDMFSASFFVDNARVVGVDDGKPSGHTNTVGEGLEYYLKSAPHPHLHIPVPDSSYGYAIPLDEMSVDQLWQLFLEQAGIQAAPPFMRPPEEQGSLSL